FLRVVRDVGVRDKRQAVLPVGVALGVRLEVQQRRQFFGFVLRESDSVVVGREYVVSERGAGRFIPQCDQLVNTGDHVTGVEVFVSSVEVGHWSVASDDIRVELGGGDDVGMESFGVDAARVRLHLNNPV